MKNIIYFSLLCVLLSACNKGGGDSSQPSGDPNVGEYLFGGQESDGGVLVYVLNIQAGNKIETISAKLPNATSMTGYYQKSIGTYVKTGDQYAVTWSFESCNPVHTQTVKIDSSNPAQTIAVTIGATTTTMENYNVLAQSAQPSLLSLTEDTDCTHVN